MPSEKQIEAWPLYGYAPGMYSAKCSQCGKIYQGEKRSFNCLECAVTQAKQALTALEPAEPASDVEPVAWLMRDQGTTVTLNKVQADEWGWDGKDIQPLYTRPPESRLREALEWYAEQARLCRLIHSGGDAGRNALAKDGGAKARAALAQEDG